MSLRCPVCAGEMKRHAEVTVLGRHRAMLAHCGSCGFLAMPEPHWLEEAYSSAIASTDTGIMMRNLNTSEQLAVFLYTVFGERGNGRYLDIAGGYGLLVRLMRDRGFDFYWADKYAENLVARGFEWPAEDNAPCVAVTAMEVLEHVPDPLAFLSAAMMQGKTDTVIFSTSIYGTLPPAPANWSYYSLETGQHISFFQQRTLQHIAKQLGGHYFGIGDMHVISRRTIPISALLARLSFSRARHLLLPFVSRRMSGRVLVDHQHMIARLQQSAPLDADQS